VVVAFLVVAFLVVALVVTAAKYEWTSLFKKITKIILNVFIYKINYLSYLSLGLTPKLLKISSSFFAFLFLFLIALFFIKIVLFRIQFSLDYLYKKFWKWHMIILKRYKKEKGKVAKLFRLCSEKLN